MSTRLIIFDFDGTLGDTRRNIVTTMQMTISAMGLPCRSEQQCASTIGLPLAGCFETLFPDLQPDRIQLCAETYRRLFDENLRAIKPQLFPRVAETLKALKMQGFVLTIASSRSHASLSGLTKDLGIFGCISLMIGADDVVNAKPHPEPVLKTLSVMQFSKDEALVVGDMAVDILMGVNAGIRTCGVTWGNGTRAELEEAGADYIIGDIGKLIKIVSPVF